MTERKINIFVVDDDPVSRMIAACRLEQEPSYAVRELDSGEALLAAIGDAPDIILLDIEMPGMNGISACRALREGGDDHAVVLFVSGNDDLETRLAAYRVGGNDYILKPCIPEELFQKVQIAEQFLAQREALAQQARFAQQTAFTAMSSMGEMGSLLEFLRASFACHDAAQLATALFGALGQYGLSALLRINTANISSAWQCFSSRGLCTPLEVSILVHMQGMERIFQLSGRLAINYPNVTLLVLDLPIADPDRAGRLRDHLAVLIEGAEARINAMQTEVKRLEQAKGISRAVVNLTRTLAEIEKMQAGNRASAMEIDAEYLRELTNAFVHLGLSEDQEAALADMAHQAHARLEALMDEGRSVGDLLREVVGHLGRLVEA